MRFRIGIDFDIEESNGRGAEAALEWLTQLGEMLEPEDSFSVVTSIGGETDEARRSLLAFELATYGLAQTLEADGDEVMVEILGRVPDVGEEIEGEVVAE